MTNSKKLVLVGSGIKSISHFTHEAVAHIKSAKKVLFLLNEPMLERYIQELNPSNESLEPLYFEHQSRHDSYAAIQKHIEDSLNDCDFLCVVLYGHPTVFSSPGLAAIKNMSLREDVESLVLPGVSSEDCLYADLSIDPGQQGSYSIDATTLLTRKQDINPYSHLIIWQIAMTASLTHDFSKHRDHALSLLLKKLYIHYPKNHQVQLYEAAIYPGLAPKVVTFELQELCSQHTTKLSTLYIPPVSVAALDDEVLRQLNLQ